MITTTLNKILAHNPCWQTPGSGRGWDKLLLSLGNTEPDDEPLPLLTILESNGFKDAFWSLRTIEDIYDREIRLLACQYTCHSLSYYEKMYPGDMRPRQAIEIASLYAEKLVVKRDRDSLFITKAVATGAAAYSAYSAYAVYHHYSSYCAADAAAKAAAAAADDAKEEKEFQKQEFILMVTQGHDYMKMEGV